MWKVEIWMLKFQPPDISDYFIPSFLSRQQFFHTFFYFISFLVYIVLLLDRRCLILAATRRGWKIKFWEFPLDFLHRLCISF